MGIHWFSGTTKRPFADVLDVISGLRMGAPIVQHQHGAKGGYSHSATCGGVFVAWGQARPDVLVTVGGEVCEEMGIAGLVALSICAELEPSSRLDVAWDAYGWKPEQFGQAFEAGDVVTRIQRPVNPETGRIQGIERRSNHEGDTVYLGSRTSERFLRVYDRRGPSRVELELKEQRAVALWRRLIELNDEAAWGMESLAELRAFIDFRHLEHSVLTGKPIPPADRRLVGWWAEFCQGADRRSTVIPREGRKLEDVDRWLRRVVAPSFALLVDAFGSDFSRDMLTLGRAAYRARPDRLALLEDAKLRGVVRPRLAEAAD